MSDAVCISFKLIFCLLASIFVFHIVFNIWGLYIVYSNISTIAYSVEQIISQNNGIPKDYNASICQLLWSAQHPDTIALSGGDKKVAIDNLIMTTTFINNGTSYRTQYRPSTAENVISTSQNIPQAEFGDYIMLNFTFTYDWFNPIRVGTSDEVRNGSEVFVGGGKGLLGLKGNSTAIENKEGIILTGANSNRISLTLRYRVPCMRYYPT